MSAHDKDVGFWPLENYQAVVWVV